MFGPNPQKTAAVVRATASAREALAAGATDQRLAIARSELEIALVDGGDSLEVEARREGHETLRELRDRLRELGDAKVDRELRPCPSCGSSALLVGQPASVELAGIDVDVVRVVCRACGDVRTRCDEAARAKLAGARSGDGRLVFREVDLGGREGPYR